MKKLTKHDIALRDRFAAQLQSARDALEEAVETYNAAVEKAFAPVGQAIETYNAVLEDVMNWADDIAGQIQEYIQECSDRWQGGEAGQAYAAWLAVYETLGLEDVEMDEPEPLQCDIDDHASALAELPEQPE